MQCMRMNIMQRFNFFLLYLFKKQENKDLTFKRIIVIKWCKWYKSTSFGWEKMSSEKWKTSRGSNPLYGNRKYRNNLRLSVPHESSPVTRISVTYIRIWIEPVNAVMETYIRTWIEPVMENLLSKNLLPLIQTLKRENERNCFVQRFHVLDLTH